MRALLPVLFAEITPLLVLSLIIIGAGLSLVAWQPPILWTSQFDTPSFACYCTPTNLFSDSSGTYVAGSVLNAFPGQVPVDFGVEMDSCENTTRMVSSF